MTVPSAPVPPPVPTGPSRFHVHQKLTPLQNTYRVMVDEGGSPGRLIAFAKQKRLAFKEQFTLYADESGTRQVLTVQADRRIDIRSQMTVRDPAGAVVGVLRKRGTASLLRSTWEVEQPGAPLVVVQESNAVVAILRRVLSLVPYADLIPWVFHFDGTTPDGRQVLRHTRQWGIRDRYVLEVQPGLDARLAIALAVCLDAMQKR